ncbi:hypothetical protein BGZ83_007044 [Gryganskiella cystojenkinii]|nr:hypothetical protein BGZ83_007044 [Gryganskiella cystojenkinii]
MHTLTTIATPFTVLALLALLRVHTLAAPVAALFVPIDSSTPFPSTGFEKRQQPEDLQQQRAVVSSNDYIASHSLSLMNFEGDRISSAVSRKFKRGELQQVNVAQMHRIQPAAADSAHGSKRH